MAAMRWRIRALETGQASGSWSARALRLCDANGPIDAAAALSCPLPVGGDGLGALTDGDAGTAAAFAVTDIKASGWSILWTFAAAVEPTQLLVDTEPLYGFVLEAFYEAEGAWATVIGRFQKDAITGLFSLSPGDDLSAVFTQISDVRNLEMPLGGFASQSMEDGGVRTSVSSNSMVYAFDALPQEASFKGMGAEFDFKIVDDATSRRHIGFFLFDPARPTYGYRIATLDGTLVLSYFAGAFGNAETVYQQLPMPLGGLMTNTRYTMGIVVDDFGGITVKLNGVVSVVFNPPATMLATVRLGVFFYIGGYITYSCHLNAVRPILDSRAPGMQLQAMTKDLGIAPAAAKFAACESPAGLDIEFGGRGRFYGMVSDDKSKTLLQRRVRLFRSRDGYLVREVWSAADGSYRFEGINERYEYDIEAWDHEKNYFSAVANNQIPEVVA
jgi:hypothetical protein